MASEIRSFSPVIPAGTAVGAGWSADLSFPPRIVEKVTIRVPPGPSGEVGFYLGSAGTSIIPANSGQYIVTDDEVLSFDLVDQIESGAWFLYGYNVGNQDHTIYIRFALALPRRSPAVGVSTVIPASSLAFGS